MLNQIIEEGYCVGCGACASESNSPYQMAFTENGVYLPELRNAQKSCCSSNQEKRKDICPFEDWCMNEDEISGFFYKNVPGVLYSNEAGYYLKNFAGFVRTGDYRTAGSSGGMVSWLVSKLLETGSVDYVIHVKPSQSGQKTLYAYGVSKSAEEVLSGAKSKYYPVEISQVMSFVKANPGRYVFVGVPCFVKAVRLLTFDDSVIKERIIYTIALVCGHLKSDRFAKAMAWEMGIHPNSLYYFDFRVKHEGRSASNYGVEAQGLIDGEKTIKRAFTRDLFCSDWGRGFFKLSACDYCDDVIGETADISIGDAWLPKYVDDSKGTNIITIRNPELLSMLTQNSDELHLEEIGIDNIIRSQEGGFRHRREGLAYRLFLKDAQGLFRPKKRVEANAALSKKRKRIYEERLVIRQLSFEAYEKAKEVNDFDVLKETMREPLKDYQKLYLAGLGGTILAFIKRTAKVFLPECMIRYIKRKT